MAGIDLFTTIMDYMGTRNATPTVQTANIPEKARAAPGKILKNPHASMESVMRELAVLTIDELNAQVSRDTAASRNPQFVSAFTKIPANVDYPGALSSVIAETTPRAPGTSTAATDMMILLDLATRAQRKGR